MVTFRNDRAIKRLDCAAFWIHYLEKLQHEVLTVLDVMNGKHKQVSKYSFLLLLFEST